MFAPVARTSCLRPTASCRAAWIWPLVVALLFATAVRSRCQNAALEYQVKAGFLMNFAKYVEWPIDQSDATPFVIGLLSADAAAPIIQRTLSGKSVLPGRPVVVKLLNDLREIQGCDLVFVSRHQKDRLAELITRAADLPILTVGETETFCDRGGMINFVMREESVRFEINLKSAAEAGLKISSRLASLAVRIVQ